CAESALREPQRAVELARQVVRQRPYDGRGREVLGVALYRAGDWSNARTELAQASELVPGEAPIAWLFLGLTYAKLGDDRLARSWCVRAVTWMTKNQACDEEWRRFRREAVGLIRTPDLTSL